MGVVASWVNIGKCPVHHIRICPRERYGRSHRLRHGGVTGGASAAIFLISWTRRYEHTDPLGDPGTSLTTAVSKNVLRREPLPTVRACTRGFGLAPMMRKQRKAKISMTSSHGEYRASRTHLCFIRSGALLTYAVKDREGPLLHRVAHPRRRHAPGNMQSQPPDCKATPASLTVVCEARQTGRRGGTVSNGPLVGA